MDVLARCEVCEKPITGERVVHPEEGDSYCVPCVISLSNGHVAHLERQLAGAVEALDALRDEREKQIRGTIPPSGFFARLDALLAESPTNRGQ